MTTRQLIALFVLVAAPAASAWGQTPLPAAVATAGDYNNDGALNAADYTVYRNVQSGIGGTTLPNENPGITPGVTTIEDYDFWKSQYTYSPLGSGAGARPSILSVPQPYSPISGGVEWDVFVTQLDPSYSGALAVELPIQFSAIQGLAGSGGDDTNGSGQSTWYYNETAAGSGVLLWNVTEPANAANHVQNPGSNPFTAGVTDGLYINTGANRLFAALGSTIGMGDALPDTPGKQVRLLHTFTSGAGGTMAWTNAIIAENGVQYSGITGSASVPEPASAWLLGLSMMLVSLCRGRKRRR